MLTKSFIPNISRNIAWPLMVLALLNSPRGAKCQNTAPFVGSQISGQKQDALAFDLLKRAESATGGTALSGLTSITAQGIGNTVEGLNSFVWTETPSNYRYTYTDGVSGHIFEEIKATDGLYQAEEGKTLKQPEMLNAGHFCLADPWMKLLQLSSNPSATLQYVDSITVDNQVFHAIKSSEGSAPAQELLTQKTWYFDPISNLLVALDYFTPGPRILNRGLLLRAHFKDYRDTQGVLLPFRIEVDTPDGQLPETFLIQTVKINDAIPSSTFSAQ